MEVFDSESSLLGVRVERVTVRICPGLSLGRG